MIPLARHIHAKALKANNVGFWVVASACIFIAKRVSRNGEYCRH